MFSAIESDHTDHVRDSERMDFKSFAQVYRNLRLFMKYSRTVNAEELKSRLCLDEFKALMIDPELDPLFEATV